MTAIYILVLGALCAIPSTTASLVLYEDIDVIEFKENGIGYYKTLYPNDGSLYIGGAGNTDTDEDGRLFRVDLTDISDQTSLIEARLIKNDTADLKCEDIVTTTPEYICRNHIKVILEDASDTSQLFVCGTNSRDQRCYTVPKTLAAAEIQTFDARRKCPLDPDEPVATIFGDNHKVYSATEYRATGDASISKAPVDGDHELETSPDSKWVSKPAQFIDAYKTSIGSDKSVLFFFREKANEQTIQYPEEITYSRVSKVCEADAGGNSNVLDMQFSSFLKARLQCAAGNDDFKKSYNVLEDTTSDQSGDNFYVIFTANRNGVPEPALCVYSLANINSVLDVDDSSEYLDQLDPSDSNSLWGSQNPSTPEAPGKCSSTTPHEDTLTALKSHPLMYDLVQSSGEPQLTDYAGVKFTKIVYTDVDGTDVLYIGTDEGSILKVIMEGNEAKVIQTIQVSYKGEAITVMEVAGDYLYLGFDDKVVQIPVMYCDKYKDCDSCTTDPHCGWDGHSCTSSSGGSSSCDVAEETSQILLVIGSDITLESTASDATWTKDGVELIIDGNKYEYTQGIGLKITNCQDSDEGVYQTGSRKISLTTYLENQPCSEDQSISSMQGEMVNAFCCPPTKADLGEVLVWKDPKGNTVNSTEYDRVAWANVVHGGDCPSYISWMTVNVSTASEGDYTCEKTDGTVIKRVTITLDKCVTATYVQSQVVKYDTAAAKHPGEDCDANNAACKCEVPVIECTDCCP